MYLYNNYQLEVWKKPENIKTISIGQDTGEIKMSDVLQSVLHWNSSVSMQREYLKCGLDADSSYEYLNFQEWVCVHF